MKKLLIIPFLLLAGCNDSTAEPRDPAPESPGSTMVYTVNVNGYEEPIVCIWTKAGYGAGLSCDFVNAKKVQQ